MTRGPYEKADDETYTQEITNHTDEDDSERKALRVRFLNPYLKQDFDDAATHLCLAPLHVQPGIPTA